MSAGEAVEFAALLDAISPDRFGRTPPPAMDAAGWDLTVRAAAWHRLGPMLAGHLAGTSVAPPGIMAELDEQYLANAARNLFIAASLRQVLETLGAAEIPAMLLKGAALVETVYPDPALREMLDLDLLVPADRLGAANAALSTIGYRPQGEGPTSPSGRGGHHHEPALISDRGLVAVELHHHIATSEEGGLFDLSGFWQRARPSAQAPGHLVPAPDDLLLHVALHFTRNRLGGNAERGGFAAGALSQLGDIAWTIDRSPPDWDRLVTTARGARIDARVFLALFAARRVGAAVPVATLNALRPPGFDPRLGRRLVALRVLRSGRQLPVRRLRWIVAPPREALTRGWDADARAPASLARAYVRRAAAQAPLAREAARRPWMLVQDFMLDRRLSALARPDQGSFPS